MLPGVRDDLGPWFDRSVAALPARDHAPVTAPEKWAQLSGEFDGMAEAQLLHAFLIANLRRKAPPEVAAPLFNRLWAEHGAALMRDMSIRWMLSALTTFADHGATPAQREIGLGITVLCTTLKLTETERLFSGQPPNRAWPRGRRAAPDLPLDMEAYSVRGGDAAVNMLGRLWTLAQADPVTRPPASHVLTLLAQDPRAVFARLDTMRARMKDRMDRQAAR
jgi:hypothetical protein